MLLTIPVLVVEQKQKNQAGVLQTVRPLFFAKPVEQADSLQRALNKLAAALRRDIEAAGKEARHDHIARMCFAPRVKGKLLDFKINLGAENFACRYFFAEFAGFEKKLAFTPNVPEIWFEIERGEDLQTRAETVTDEYFRRLSERDGRGSQNPEQFNFAGKTWLTSLDFDVALEQKYESKETGLFAFLGASEKMNGAEELRKTAVHLDSLYPHELERAARRETALTRLTEFLDAPDQRPVLLVGNRLAGKTALVHEYVFRQIENRPNARQPERNVWLLAPQRLVAGMMYVGQWEERLLAILKEAELKRHLLYFDDLIGLFLAGQSANSSLSMAQVLKPYLEKRTVRILAEITTEALRVLQERDRSFADLFQIVRVAETDADETLRIALGIRRALEQKHDCFFQLDALPAALDLQRRYQRDLAFPGKIAVFLRQLAVKFSQKEISRADVLAEFEIKSGMSVQFLDDKTRLDRREIIEKIERGVIGQTVAVRAAADVISIAKARLNDTSRPLASFLFLGATGVGKTEAAKQIAEYLYGDTEKLLRFDMNEFVSAFDAARLVGTFDQPEGLLTSQIRRQPFAVILLDEIEKAHPDVFNLLLQVMGDGRLTDALGRTADFTNAIIILTSNLGAREAAVKLGFRQSEESEAATFVRATEKFFKPEFINRFDRIVPFERLRREDVRQIADKQLKKLFARDGLERRNCRLNIAPEALEIIVDAGYHPQLGARALKRTIETLLAQPIARRLAALQPDAPVIVHVQAENNQIAIQVHEIKPAQIQESVWLVKDFSDVDLELDQIADLLDEIEDRIEPLKPIGEVLPNDIRHKRYFLVREHTDRVTRMIARAERWNAKTVQSPKSKVQSRKSSKSSERNLVTLRAGAVDLAKILSESNLSFRLKDLAATSRAFGEQIEDYVQDIWRETALAWTLIDDLDNLEDRVCTVQILTQDAAGEKFAADLLKLYEQLFSNELGLQFAVSDSPFAFVVTGANAIAAARTEAGTHLFVTERQGFVSLEVKVLPQEVKVSAAENPIKNPNENSVVRVFDGRGKDLRFALDFRSGLLASDVLTVRELRAFVLSGLPLPAKLK